MPLSAKKYIRVLMTRTFKETCEMVFDWSSFYKGSIRLSIFILAAYILWQWQGIEIIKQEMPIIGSGFLALTVCGSVVFLANLLFVVPYQITSYNYKKNKNLKREMNALKDSVQPSLIVHELHFEERIQPHDQFTETSYKLAMECSNPKESIRSIYGIKVFIKSAEPDWGDLRKCRLKFEHDTFNPEATLHPGDDRHFHIATFYRTDDGPLKLNIYYDTPDREGKSQNELAIKEELRIAFRVSCENQQGQEWEVLFGLKNNQLWATATQKFPTTDAEEVNFNAKMLLNPDTPPSATQ